MRGGGEIADRPAAEHEVPPGRACVRHAARDARETRAVRERVCRIVSQAEYVLPTPGDVVWFLEWLDREWPMSETTREAAPATTTTAARPAAAPVEQLAPTGA